MCLLWVTTVRHPLCIFQGWRSTSREVWLSTWRDWITGWKGGWQKRGRRHHSLFPVFKWLEGGGGVFTAARFPLNGFRSSGRMRKSERHAGAEATGMSGAPEFYHRRCHKNKCPLPGSIRAEPRIHWVNNPPKYFTLISSGWPTVNTRIAILLGPLGSHWLLICNLVRRRVMFSNFTTAWSLKPYLLINLWAKMLRCAYMNVYSEQINTQNHSTEKPG